MTFKQTLLFSTFFLALTCHAKPPSKPVGEWVKTALDWASQGKLPNAEKLLKKLAAHQPSNGFIWFNLGYVHSQQQNYAAAEKDYARVIHLQHSFAVVAKLYRAQALEKISNLDSACDLFVELKNVETLPNIRKLIDAETADFKQRRITAAIEFYRAHQYEEASQDIDRALKLENAPSSKLLKALILLDSGETYAAQNLFREVMDSSSEKTLREEALNWIRQMETGVVETSQPWHANGETGLGYRTNVFGEGFGGDWRDRPLLRFEGHGSYDTLKEKKSRLRLHYNLQLEELLGFSSLRSISHSFELEYQRTLPKWEWGTSASVDQSFIGSSGFLLTPLGELRLQRNWNQWEIGTRYSFRKNFALDDFYSYLAGNIHTVNFYGGYFGSRSYYNPYLTYTVYDVGDYIQPGVRVPVNYRGGGGGFRFIWYSEMGWELHTNAAYLLKHYAVRTIPFNQERRDAEVSASLEINYFFSQKFWASLSSLWLRNFSTLGNVSVDNKNYIQSTYVAGLVWEPLP